MSWEQPLAEVLYMLQPVWVLDEAEAILVLSSLLTNYGPHLLSRVAFILLLSG